MSRRVRGTSFLICLTLLAFAGCAVDADDDPTSSEASETSQASQASELTEATEATAYYRLESTAGGGRSVVSLAQHGSLRCPSGQLASRCTVDALVLPADCGWECQDGLLSLRGDTVLRGRLTSAWDTATHQRVSRLIVAAGFDTYRTGAGSHALYRLTPASTTCTASPCPAAMRAQRIGKSGNPAHVTHLDFSQADDDNYVLDPARGHAQVLSAQGLLVSGTLAGTVFRADRVYRLWTPRPACDPQLVARAHWFHGGETVVDHEFITTYEAERYADPDGRTSSWLVRDAEDAAHVEFLGGLNDLWAERFSIDKASCALTVTGEH